MNLYEKLFYKSLLIRLVEEKIIELYPSDKIQSPVHLSIGQEAIAVGVCEALEKDDLIFGNYRGHAFYIAKGGDLKELFAELYGRVTGMGQGKSGSMHLFSKKVGMMGSSAVVSSTIPHAVGSAFASKYQNKEQLNVAIFGDGATEEGVFHESLNFASLHQLPVIFLCENNGLAVHSFLKARQSYNLLELAKVYNIPTIKIEEGYDFIEVHNQFSKVVEYVRKNKTPYFVEITSYRYKEHVGPGDDFNAGYRSVEAFNEWKAKDPLIQNKALVEKFNSQIREEINRAVDFAEKSAEPNIDHLLSDVY